MARRESLRARIRAAGGLYLWLNRNLIRIAGPAQLGPWDAPPRRAEAPPCPECGQAWDRHVVDRSLGRSAMHCPRPATTA